HQRGYKSSFFSNAAAPTRISSLSLHDALPIFEGGHMAERCAGFIIIALGEAIVVDGATFADLIWTPENVTAFISALVGSIAMWRSEEHTSELQSRENLVCRLLLEKKKSSARTG